MIAEYRLPMDEIISHRLPLEEFQKRIAIGRDGSRSLKVTLQP